MLSTVLRRGVARLQRPSFHLRLDERSTTGLHQLLTSSVLLPNPNDHPSPQTPNSTRSHQPPLSPTSFAPQATAAAAPAPAPPLPKTEKPRPKLRATKAALTLTPAAVNRLRTLLSGPTPTLIRIGVRSKGCAGLSYHLDYTDKSEQFDEIIEQDGVRVLIDSKALFSIIGSEMDWQEDALSAKFAFKNPNIVDACGCGESFTVGS